jgi:hypothetical protein
MATTATATQTAIIPAAAHATPTAALLESTAKTAVHMRMAAASVANAAKATAATAAGARRAAVTAVSAANAHKRQH